jgi:hypothetical protein
VSGVIRKEADIVATPAPRLTLWEIVKLVCWASKVLAVAGFVVWHLLFLLVRNPLDVRASREPSWSGPTNWPGVQKAWQSLDRNTTSYGNFLRIEQGWTMFTAPLSRDGDFLDVRLVFADGERVRIPSDNAVNPSTLYLRRGHFRQRKLEDYLIDLVNSGRADSPLVSAQVRARLADWQRRHPEDGRLPERVELVRCRFLFPQPGSNPRDVAGPYEECLAAFDANGQPLPVESPP